MDSIFLERFTLFSITQPKETMCYLHLNPNMDLILVTDKHRFFINSIKPILNGAHVSRLIGVVTSNYPTVHQYGMHNHIQKTG